MGERTGDVSFTSFFVGARFAGDGEAEADDRDSEGDRRYRGRGEGERDL